MKKHEIRERFDLGGPGSGHHGHRGIPGQVGGSSTKGGIADNTLLSYEKDGFNSKGLPGAKVIKTSKFYTSSDGTKHFQYALRGQVGKIAYEIYTAPDGKFIAHGRLGDKRRKVDQYSAQVSSKPMNSEKEAFEAMVVAEVFRGNVYGRET